MGRVKVRQTKSDDKETRLRRALQEKAEKGTSLRELALKYGVGRSTISDRARGGQSMRQAMEVYQKVTPSMERALVRWVDQMEATGFPPRLDFFKAMAAHLAKMRAEEEGDPTLGNLGTRWLQNFLDRHPELSTRFAAKLDRQRALASQPGPIRDYFRALGNVLKKYKFKPENMYNMDEKGFLLGDGSRAKVIVRRGRKPPKETQDGSREWITVIETCAANYTMLLPMVIFKGQGLYRGWYDMEVEMDPRTVFAHSPKGFTTDELALRWLRDYFDPWTKSRANGQPRLLLLDGHRSHYSLEFVRYARHNDIILVSYPGHSTHLLQPLDVVLFAPLQKAYSDAVANYTRTSRAGITKKDFWKFYAAAMDKAYTRENIKAAWRRAGISPYNPDTVLQPLLQKLQNKGSQRHVPKKAAEIHTPSRFMAWKTPQNRRELRHQTEVAINFFKLGTSGDATTSSIALLRRLAHQTESAITQAEIANIEKEDIRARYAGKTKGKSSRQKLTKAQVADWAFLEKMEKEAREKDRIAEEKVQAKVQKAKVRTQKAASGKGKGKEAVSTATAKKTVTIVLSDDTEASGVEEDSELEGNAASAPSAGSSRTLRPRTRSKQVYSGYAEEDWDYEEDLD